MPRQMPAVHSARHAHQMDVHNKSEYECRGTCERATKRKGTRDRLIDIDPQYLCSFLVLRDRTDGAPGARLLQQPRGQQYEEHGHRNHEDICKANDDLGRGAERLHKIDLWQQIGIPSGALRGCPARCDVQRESTSLETFAKPGRPEENE